MCVCLFNAVNIFESELNMERKCKRKRICFVLFIFDQRNHNHHLCAVILFDVMKEYFRIRMACHLDLEWWIATNRCKNQQQQHVYTYEKWKKEPKVIKTLETHSFFFSLCVFSARFFLYLFGCTKCVNVKIDAIPLHLCCFFQLFHHDVLQYVYLVSIRFDSSLPPYARCSPNYISFFDILHAIVYSFTIFV